MSHHEPDEQTEVCVYCQHPIRHYAQVGWVDTVSVERGGLYDFCISTGGDHLPLPHV